MSLHQFHLIPPDHRGLAVSIWQVRQILGRTDHSDRVFVAYLQSLVDECGFPRPYPSHVKGKGLVYQVTGKSSFRRDAVEAWAGDFLPPACADALDAAARDQAAQAMDQAALGLGRPLQLIEGGRA